MPASLHLVKYVQFGGTLTCQTGLRIGGSKDDLEIGASDNPILRDPLTRLPYIPGSSLKGKMRTLLEWRYSAEKVQQRGEPCGCAQENCLVCTVFGPHKVNAHNLGPSRLLARDALLTEGSREQLQRLQEEGLLYSELKTEVSIDRRTGKSFPVHGGLRTQERVPAGAEFSVNLCLRIFEGDDEDRLVSFVEEGLDLLQSDALGGSGSRGYGWVSIRYEISR